MGTAFRCVSRGRFAEALQRANRSTLVRRQYIVLMNGETRLDPKRVQLLIETAIPFASSHFFTFARHGIVQKASMKWTGRRRGKTATMSKRKDHRDVHLYCLASQRSADARMPLGLKADSILPRHFPIDGLTSIKATTSCAVNEIISPSGVR